MAVKSDGLFDLEDFALETGSSVEYPDGRRFNSAGVQAQRRIKDKPVEAAPSPTASVPAAPAPSMDMTAVMRQLIAAINRPVEVTLPPMPAPQVVVKEAEKKASAPRSWTFEFERNSNGTIKKIHAKAGD